MASFTYHRAPEVVDTFYSSKVLTRVDILGRGRHSSGVSSPPPVEKRPIHAPGALNEAYDYASPVPFSRGMRVDLGAHVMLFVSGTASVDERGRSVHAGDFTAQAWRMFDNIKALLEAEGATFRDVVRTTIYVADFRYYDQLNDVRAAFYAREGVTPYPASTCVRAELCRPELLVETEAIAIIRGA